MSIVKNGSNINKVTINNKNIGEIYYGNQLIYSSIPKVIKIVFRDIDENGNLTSATGDINGLFDNIISIGNYGLSKAFTNCIGITGSINFPKLTSIADQGLYYTFNNCTGITSANFPSLTSIGNKGLYEAFFRCNGITELHFRADTKDVIESSAGYSNKFGATKATIYFDL